MARVSEHLTQAEIDFAFKFLTDKNVYMEGEIGTQNATEIVNYLVDAWKVEVTEQTLTTALERLGNRIRFYTPVESEYKTLAGRVTEQQRKLILNMIESRGLQDTDDAQMVNFNTICSYYLDKNVRITADTFDDVVGRIVNGGKRPLLWKARKPQGSEAELQASREAASQQQPTTKTDDVEIPKNLPGYLHQHYRSMHAKTETVAPSTPASADTHYKDLAESAVQSIVSNNDRAEAQKLLNNAGKWGWQLTYNTIVNFISKRQHQRSMARR